MIRDSFYSNVFINCPFDSEYEPLLEVLCFCVVCFGLTPRLANERIDSGENRLDKIIEIISASRYSIHDLSRCRATQPDGLFRMNMPFELGIDFGLRKSSDARFVEKKFLVFEEHQYDLKRALSDLAGTDVEFHELKIKNIVIHVRNFFKVEAEINAPGAPKIIGEYLAFQGWMVEKKIFEGHTEEQARRLPISERLEEMRIWFSSGRPAEFVPKPEA